MSKTAPELDLKSLIKNSPLISSQTKERLLSSMSKFSEKQQEDIKKAIEEAESELENILAKSLDQNAEKVNRIERQLEQVWKHYIQNIEAISKTSEEQKQQELLDSL